MDSNFIGQEACERVAEKDAELTTTAAQWTKRGDVHRDLVFNLSHGALAKAKLKPPRTFKEAKIADEMARKACGLDQLDDRSQALLIHINELSDDLDAQPIEASIIDAELPPCPPVSGSQEIPSLKES